MERGIGSKAHDEPIAPLYRKGIVVGFSRLDG
jgi:hypothetical protein